MTRPDVRFLRHCTLDAAAAADLRDVERLTLWNVKRPPGLLAELPRLWWLDIRGGSGGAFADLGIPRQLRFLQLNQVRGLSDLSGLERLERLELLSLYGLARVEKLPDMSGTTALRRVELGQMTRLADVSGLGAAPALEELHLARRLPLDVDDVRPLVSHPRLRRFGWFAEDAPAGRTSRVVEAMARPPARPMHPEEWFGIPRRLG